MHNTRPTGTRVFGSSRPSAVREIPVRRLDVDLANVEMHEWLVPGDPIFSHFLATLSAVFPTGEDFFVATVRRHKGAVADDPLLTAQVKAFVGQEAMHGREHRVMNARMAELGYDTVRADAEIGRILARLLRLRPSTLPLAVTAASEHFTGVLAEAVLGDETTRRTLFSRPEVEPLITWHALEELEHKNVAFDVLDRASGRYMVRVGGFAVTVVSLVGYVVAAWIRAAHADKRITWRHRRRFLHDLRRQRILSPWFLARLARYLRPGFHPDDMDTDELVQEWQARLAATTTVTAGLRRSA